jgi:hypothetical protein
VPLVTRYAERFADALAAIDANVADPPGKLDAYAALHADVPRAGRMCPVACSPPSTRRSRL